MNVRINLKLAAKKTLLVSVIALGVIVAVLFSVKFLLRGFVRQQVDSTLQKVSESIHQPIVFQNFDFNFSSITLTDFAVGHGPFFSVSNLVIAIDILPWSKTFKKIKSLQGDYYYLKLSTEEIGALNLGLHPNMAQNIIKKFPIQSQKIDAIAKFKTAVILKYFTAEAQIAFKNGKFIWQRLEKTAIDIESVNFAILLNGERDPVLEIIYLSKLQKNQERPFKVQISTEGERAELISIKFSGEQIPDPLVNLMPWVRGAPALEGVLTLNHIDTASFRFNSTMQIDNLSLDNPRLSYEPVGPIGFHVSTSGVIDLTDQQLQVENFNLVFNSESSTPVVLQMSSLINIRKTLTAGENPGSAITLALTMPSTDCSSIIQTFPESILGDVKKFKLEGRVDFGVSFQFNIKNPEETSYRFDQFNFECQILEAPVNFSQAYLQAPFVLERASDGEKIKEIHVDPKDPGFATYDAIAKILVDTVVASEDTGFWAHHGVEAGAIEQAVKRNLTEGRMAVGGSTITMQTARNLFLSRDKNLTRKLQEVFLSWYLEKTLGKKRILEIYLNIIEFGPNIFGIQNASQHYFRKPAAALTLKQSVFLAQLLPAPVSRYRNFCLSKPTENFNFLMENLLSRMLKLGRITSENYAMALNSPLKFAYENRLGNFCASRDIK